MAGKVRNLLNRDGRYFARLVIPKELRPFMDRKTELRTPLGPDYRTALKKLPGAVALLQHEIAVAERKAVDAGKSKVTVGRYPLALDQIMLRNYRSRLADDDEMRDRDATYGMVGVDDLYAATLRDGIAGKLTDAVLAELVGHRIDYYRGLGNTDAVYGTEDWRKLARGICASDYEALSRVAERDEGDFTGQPKHPALVNAALVPEPVAEKPPLPFKTLFNDYLASRKAVGRGAAAAKRWEPIFYDLKEFVGRDDARQLTKQNLLDWRDKKLATLAARTVSHVYLTAVRTVLTWAVENDRLETNVADKVRQEVPKRNLSREQGFTLAEAVAVLKASRNYRPEPREYKSISEAAQTTAAKQWAPILCAFTGARVAEITQLRKQDLRQEGDIHIMRITPDAGTVKAGGYRDVPLHQQLIDLGFLDFAKASADGPLFYVPEKSRDAITGAQTVAARVGRWLQGLNVIPDRVSPSHGWRHRFKTVGREQGVSDRTLDAIQGHASKTAGDNYGDVTIKARKAAIDLFPEYDLSAAD